jgi:hypothetical protein
MTDFQKTSLYETPTFEGLKNTADFEVDQARFRRIEAELLQHYKDGNADLVGYETYLKREGNTRSPDPYTIRVRGGDPNSTDPSKRPTEPGGLSRSILHVMSKNPDGWVNVTSVGEKAHSIALRAYRMAKSVAERRTSGIKIVIDETEYTAEINGKRTVGLCTRIFPIPIKYAL